MMAMLTVEEALERVLGGVAVLPAECKPLVEALGQVLDEDVSAGFDIPPLSNSGMDGYAVRAADVEGSRPDRPRELAVIAEVAAGHISDAAVLPGSAIRIMTGAPIPEGADAVVPFEDTDEGNGPTAGAKAETTAIRIFKPVMPGANIRPAGEDVRAGELVVRRGTILRPAEIGVLASLGSDSVRVIRRPVVAILSTGDELLQPGRHRCGAQIYDANAYSIAALVSRYGGTPRLMGIARDNCGALTAKIHESLDADLLVTSAGVSRGEYDLVKDVLAREGKIEFCTVAMKPGKPLAFGFFERDGRRIPHIGLPGNPVSSMVAFELFGRATILTMMGKTDLRRPTIRAIATERITNGDCQRVLLARCIVTEFSGKSYVKLAGGQGSGMLTSMMRANALTILKPNELVEIGGLVRVLMLDQSRGEEWGSYESVNATGSTEAIDGLPAWLSTGNAPGLS
jgi:molybdopterin molybdotransferase